MISSFALKNDCVFGIVTVYCTLQEVPKQWLESSMQCFGPLNKAILTHVGLISLSVIFIAVSSTANVN